MISVAEARRRVIERLYRLPAEQVPLADCSGRVLAADVTADHDMPPFDKACMDGFAVVSEDLAAGRAVLELLETIPAGGVPACAVRRGAASRIMTGAPVPEGADAVVMVEHSAPDGERVRLEDRPRPGQHIQPRGELFRAGDVLLVAGAPIGPPELALLATAGAARVSVARRPRVAFLSTGDELVPVDERPGPGQIRDSNSHALRGLVETHGGEWTGSTLVRDDDAALIAAIEQGLANDLLLISGGVSAGDYDLVEEALERLGVERHFDALALKPGKPAVFGTRGSCLVYGLPGNPLSGFVVFCLLGVPALRHLQGRDDLDLPRLPARLAGPLRTHRIDREQYLPARLSVEQGELVLRAAGWHGSSDMRALARANCLLALPAGCDPPGEGARVEALLWHDFRLD